MSQTPKCKGPNEKAEHCHKVQHDDENQYDPTYSGNQNGVSGTGEELKNTLVKIVSQLEIISKTLHVLEQRVTMNEDCVINVVNFFKQDEEAKKKNT